MLEYYKMKLLANEAISFEKKCLQILNVLPYGVIKAIWYGNAAQVRIQSWKCQMI